MAEVGSSELEIPAAFADLAVTDEELARALADVDWEATTLGPPERWPQSLTTALDILFSSRFSMWLAWGPDLTFFCNSAYRRETLGGKFPWALGRPAQEVWAEAWSDAGPRIQTVLSTGIATRDEQLLLFLERSGYAEETYHTFSYSPLRDESGVPVGMLCVVIEQTDQVVGERRMTTLSELGSDPSVRHSDAEALRFVSEQLERNRFDLPFTLIYLFDASGDAILGARTGLPDEHPIATPRVDRGDADAWWSEGLSLAPDGVVVDLTAVPRLPTGGWPDPPVQALLVPIRQAGGGPSFGFLVVGLNRYRMLDGPYRDFVRLVAGHISAGIVTARGYQEQARRADELAALEDARTTFFSNISHEFRTPLTLIMGPVTDLLARDGTLDERGRQELSVVRRNGMRLGKLVDSLMDFSRVQAGWVQAEYAPTDIATVTAEFASVFGAVMERAGLELIIDCPTLTEPVYLDLDMWEKVIFNLLSNAMKFTLAGSVAVTVRRESDHAVVTVSDTGIGVSADEVPRVFERFHRAPSARSRSIEGTGIGLALTKDLVELHGGTITVDSHEGEGTTFTIQIPLGAQHLPGETVTGRGAAGSAAVALTSGDIAGLTTWLEPDTAGVDGQSGPGAGAAVPAAQAVPGGSVRVLIADDNPDMRNYLVRVMDRAGYQAVAVGDGKAALDAVYADPPDIVISDVTMPRMDGMTLLQILRSDARSAAVPVLLLSARADSESSIEGLQAGADDYLVKPFGALELMARVRNTVKLSRIREHHARWRSALVDSLHEGFFVSDEAGAIIEINAAFTEIVGYGTADLPLQEPFPWAPDPVADPDGHRVFADAFEALHSRQRRSRTVPLVHREGREVWVTVTFSPADDPATDRHVMVGTLRDVTAEHYMVQRDAARALLTTRLAQAFDVDQALSAALAQLREIWHATRVSAAIFHPGNDPRAMATDDARSWRELPKAQRRRLVSLRRQPELTPLSDDAGCGIRIEHPAGELVMWIDLDGKRRFTREDQLLLSLLAGHIAQALARTSQIDQQRRTALALQRALLGPSELPDGFTVRYEPASPPLEIGGDWYDTVPLSKGRIGIVVGDCVGHGLRAAAVMGQLRSACRALLLQDASPAAVLTAMDWFAEGVPGAMCTTVFCAVLDPRDGRLTYSSAGHPPCILIGPDNKVQLLQDGRSLPLAVRSGDTRPEAEIILPARSTLLLYTDGLVERRKQSLNTGIGLLCQALIAGSDEPLETLADNLMDHLAPPSGYDDDVALLLYRHPGGLTIDFPADPAELAPVRAELRDWLGRCGAEPSTTQAVLVAVGEACSNSIEHGYRNTEGGVVHLRATASADRLTLTVRDNGTWQQPRHDARRGRGVALMKGLTDEVTITSDAAGTTVEMLVRM